MGRVLAVKLCKWGKRMKKPIKIFCLLTIWVFIFTSNANAQLAVTDPLTDPLIILNIPKLAEQLSVLTEQMGYIKNQLDSLKTLKQYSWSDVSGKINDMGSIISQTNGLAYNAGNLSAQFQKAFPGYKSPQDFNQNYKDNVSTTLNTLNGVLQSLGMSAQDFTNEQTRIQRLQGLAETPQGQTQAIQASEQISTEMLSQMQLLRQTMMAQTNAQTTYYAQQVQQQASNQAGEKQMFDNNAKTAPPIGHSGESVNFATQ